MFCDFEIAPVIWDAVRHAVDERREKGQFILTGSTVIDDEEIMHTGTGRITKMAMYPMSLFESLESNGSISLGRLFNQNKLSLLSAFINRMANCIPYYWGNLPFINKPRRCTLE